MRRIIHCLAAVAVVSSPVCAATMTDIAMNAWHVVNGDSNVRGDFLLLRNESAVEADVAMEVGVLTITARTTTERRQGVLTNLTLTYDDGAKETVSDRVPADTQLHEVTFQPEYAAWRRVVHLKLVHPADNMELMVTRISAYGEIPAMYLPPTGLTSAGTLSGDASPEGLLKVKWRAGTSPPEIIAPTSRKIIVYAAKIAESNYALETAGELTLIAKDRNGGELRRYRAPVNGRVQPVLFYLGDIDLTRVDRLVFDATGNTDFAIRGAVSGDNLGGAGSVAELKQINDRLDLMVTFIEQGGRLPQSIVWQLKQLLLDYRRLE